MCEALALERAEGRSEGRAEGRMEMAKEAAASLFFQGLSYETVFNAFRNVLEKEELLQIQHDAKKDIEGFNRWHICARH